MINNYIEKIKDKFKYKAEGNNKKNIENLIVFLILLIITIIAINTIWGSNDKNLKANEITNSSFKQLANNINNEMVSSNNIENTEYNLDESLEKILSNISGVRKSTSSYYIFSNESSCGNV